LRPVIRSANQPAMMPTTMHAIMFMLIHPLGRG
jgi:hypothetical protein